MMYTKKCNNNLLFFFINKIRLYIYIMFSINPYNSFRNDTYLPEYETGPVYNSYDFNDIKERLKLDENNDRKEYIRRLELLENTSNKNQPIICNDKLSMPYMQEYNKYMLNSKNGTMGSMYNSIYSSYDIYEKYLYIFLIIILSVIILFQKNRIDNLKDLLSFRLNNLNTLSTNGL